MAPGVTTIATDRAGSWHLGATAEIADGDLHRRHVAGLELLVGFSAGEFFAILDLCPHAYVHISQGYLHEGQLTCPWHGLTFDVHSGACESWPGLEGLSRYPIDVRDGELYLLSKDPLPDAA